MTIYGDVTIDTINAMFIVAGGMIAMAQALLILHPSDGTWWGWHS